MTATATTRWHVSPAAWLPIALAIAAEAISNSLRAYGLGAHLDHSTVRIQAQSVSLSGAVLVLAAVAVSLSQARAAWVALTPGPFRQRIVSCIAAALLLAVSIMAMASNILEAQRAKTADEGGERSRYDRTVAAYQKASGELADLAATRSTAEVRAAMDAAPVSREVFRRTRECTDVTREDSLWGCRPILDLRKEMASAIRKQELEPEVTRLRNELAALPRPEVVTASEGLVTGIWAWIMGLGVVVVATFGTFIFAEARTVPPSADNENRVPPQVPVAVDFFRHAADGDEIIDWVREFRGFHGRNPKIPEVQARFPGTAKTTAWRRCKAA